MKVLTITKISTSVDRFKSPQTQWMRKINKLEDSLKKLYRVKHKETK